MRRQAQVTRHRFEIVKAQLDADGAACITFAGQIARELDAKLGEYPAQLGAVANRMQVALERGFTADRFGFAESNDRPLVAPMRRLEQPGTVAFAELREQPLLISGSHVADGVQPESGEFFGCLRTDAVDLFCGQRPNAGRYLAQRQQRQAVWFVQIGADLGQQLVWCDAHRAGEAGSTAYRILEELAGTSTLIVKRSGKLGQIDIDFVYTAVFDYRCDRAYCSLEKTGILSVLVEIDRQQHGVRGKCRCLHHAHARVHAERTCFVSAGGDHAAAGVVAQPCVFAGAVRACRRLVAPAAPDSDRLTAQIRVTQQLDRRVESVHVEVSNEAGRGR